jgi:hypothetical protein
VSPACPESGRNVASTVGEALATEPPQMVDQLPLAHVRRTSSAASVDVTGRAGRSCAARSAFGSVVRGPAGRCARAQRPEDRVNARGGVDAGRPLVTRCCSTPIWVTPTKTALCCDGQRHRPRVAIVSGEARAGRELARRSSDHRPCCRPSGLRERRATLGAAR